LSKELEYLETKHTCETMPSSLWEDLCLGTRTISDVANEWLQQQCTVSEVIEWWVFSGADGDCGDSTCASLREICGDSMPTHEGSEGATVQTVADCRCPSPPEEECTGQFAEGYEENSYP
jgi:hypothetical protein